SDKSYLPAISSNDCPRRRCMSTISAIVMRVPARRGLPLRTSGEISIYRSRIASMGFVSYPHQYWNIEANALLWKSPFAGTFSFADFGDYRKAAAAALLPQ